MSMIGNIEFLGREGKFLHWEVDVSTQDGMWNSNPHREKFAFEENLEGDSIEWIGEDPIGPDGLQTLKDELADSDYYVNTKSAEIVKYMKERHQKRLPPKGSDMRVGREDPFGVG